MQHSANRAGSGGRRRAAPVPALIIALHVALLVAGLAQGQQGPPAPATGAAAPDAADDAAGLLAEGKRLLERGELQNAAQALEAVLARNPDHAEALFILGNLYLQINRIQQGLAYLARSVSLNPQNYRLQLQLAKAYEQHGSLAEAMQEYQRVMALAPLSPEAREAEEHSHLIYSIANVRPGDEGSVSSEVETLVAAGQYYSSQNNPRGAVRAFEAALARAPEDARILYHLGNQYLKLNQVEPGLRYLARSAALTPDNYPVQLLLAKSYEDNARFADAYETYRQIVRGAPETPEGKEAETRSQSLAEKAQADQSRQRYATAPIAELVAEGKGRLGQSDLQGAMRAFEAAIAREPTLEALNLAGNLYLLLNQPESGLKHLAEAAALAPEDVARRLELAQGYERFFEMDKALLQYQEVARIAPDTPEARQADKRSRLLRARRAFRSGNAEESRQMLDALRQEFPDDPDIPAAIAANDEVTRQLGEGNQRMAQNDPRGALQVFESLVNKYPDDVSALYFAGNVSLRLSMTKQGLRYLERAARLAPDNPQVRLVLAKAYERFAVSDQAAQEYREIARRLGNTREGREANKQAKLLQWKHALNLGNPQDAQSIMDGLLREYPNDPAIAGAIAAAAEAAALINEGKARLDRGDPAGALEAFEAALSKDPSNVKAQYFASNAYKQLNQPRKALAHLARSVELSPTNHFLRLLLAEAYEEQGHLGSAADGYELVIRLARGTPEGKKAEQALSRIADTVGEVPEGQLFVRTSAAEALVAQGKALVASNDQQAAVRVFEAALLEAPQDAEVLYYLGNLYLRLNQTQRGLEHLERSVRLTPSNAQLRLILARTYERSGFPDKAREHYARLIETAPGTREAGEAAMRMDFLAAAADAREGRQEQAAQTLSRLLEENPQDQELLADIASLYVGLKRPEDALKLAEQAVAREPAAVNAYAVVIDLAVSANDLDKAVAYSTRLLALTPPDSSEFRDRTIGQEVLMGHAAAKNEDFETATVHYQRALSLDPDHRSARIALAAAYHKMKEMNKVEEILQGMIEQNPADLVARANLSALYSELGRLEDAARALEEIRIYGNGTPAADQAGRSLSEIYAQEGGAEIRERVQGEILQQARDRASASPDDTDAWAILADAARIFNNNETAIDALENIVRLKPDNIQAYAGLADFYDNASRYDEAIEAYQHVLDLMPAGAPARKPTEERLTLALAKQAFDANDTDVAETHLRKILVGNPDHYLAHYYLAIIYNGKQNYPVAAAEYEEVIRIVPNHGPAHLSLGLAYEQLKRDEDALAEYRAALRSPMSPEFTETTNSLLRDLEKRINGFSYNINYTMSYDSNYNLVREDPNGEYRSALDVSFNYRYKIDRKPVYVGLSITPSYTIYHLNQYDIFGFSISPYVTFSWRNVDYSASYSVNESELLSTEAKQNSSQGINFDMSGRLMAPWISAIPGSWRLNLGWNEFVSETSPIFDANTLSLGANINLSLTGGWRLSASYNRFDNENADPRGSDFAYVSDGIVMQLTKFLARGLSIKGGMSFTASGYKNPDSATLFTVNRDNVNYGARIGLDYFIEQNLRLFIDASYRVNDSNLFTSFILSPEDTATAIGIQSASLGDYENLTLTTGLSFSF